jgi:hypothetical protein
MIVGMNANPAVRKSTYKIEMGATTSKTPNAPATFGVNLQNLTRSMNAPKTNSVNAPKTNSVNAPKTNSVNAPKTNSVNAPKSNNSVNAPKNSTNANASSNNLKVGGKRRKTRRNSRR